MFRKDRRERRGGGVILYIKESIQAYEITLKSEADSVEARTHTHTHTYIYIYIIIYKCRVFDIFRSNALMQSRFVVLS